MGWSFTNDRAFGKAQQVLELITQRDASYAVVDHRVVGNTLWTVESRPNGRPNTIGCYLLAKSRDGGWGYKDMDESCGPSYYNCPLSLLAQAGEAPNEYARVWREKVKNYHAAKTNQGRLVKLAKVGDTLVLQGCSIDKVIVTGIKPLRGRVVDGGTTYRISNRLVASIEASV